MAEEHLNTDLGTIYYLWEGEGRENEGIDILATACKKAVTDVSFCYVVGGGAPMFIKEHNPAPYFGVVMDSDTNLNFFRRSHRSIPNFHLGTVCASLFPVLKKDIYLFVEILRLENA